MGLAAAVALPGVGSGIAHASPPAKGVLAPTTPIKHVVVIFQENVSFDHYFGTYPKAANTSGPRFQARGHTPAVNGLNTAAPGGGTLLTNNPNGQNPRRLDPASVSDILTCDQNHNYTDEQKAFDGGLMDKFTVDRRHRAHQVAGPAGQRVQLLRRQHGHRPVELRPALRHERQLVRNDVRAVLARGHQSGRRRHRQGRPDQESAASPRTRRTPRGSRRATGPTVSPATPSPTTTTAPAGTRSADRSKRRRPVQRPGAVAGAGSKAASPRPRPTADRPPRPAPTTRRP